MLEFTTTILAGGKPIGNVEIRCDKEETPIAVSDSSGIAKFTLATARSPGCHYARCTNLTLRDRARKHGELRLTVFQANGKVVQLSADSSPPPDSAPQVVLYHLTAETTASASVQGTVFANRWTWQCRGKRCSSRIAGRGPFADVCAALAAEVGPLHSCDAGYARLSASEVDNANRTSLTVSPGISARVSTRFSLLREEGAFWLVVNGGRERLAVPVEWILKPDEAVRENEGHVSTMAFDRRVQEFAVGNGLMGLRASSYEISGGSAAVAAGRDIILAFDPKSGKLADGGVRLGITKRRHRANGAVFATAHRWYAQDINSDGLIDIGTVREEAACRDGRPSFRSDRVRWHVFQDGRWVHRPALDGHSPQSSRSAELPLLGLVKSPVDYVLERCTQP